VPAALWSYFMFTLFSQMKMERLVGAYEFRKTPLLIISGQKMNYASQEVVHQDQFFEINQGRLAKSPLIKAESNLVKVLTDSRGIWLFYPDRLDLFNGSKVVKTWPLDWEPGQSVAGASDGEKFYLVYVNRGKYQFAVLRPGEKINPAPLAPPFKNIDTTCACGDRVIYWQHNLWHVNITDDEVYLQTIENEQPGVWSTLGHFAAASDFRLACDRNGLFLISSLTKSDYKDLKKDRGGLKIARLSGKTLEKPRIFFYEKPLREFAVISHVDGEAVIYAREADAFSLKLVGFSLIDQGFGPSFPVSRGLGPLLPVWTMLFIPLFPFLLSFALALVAGYMIPFYHTEEITLSNGQKCEYAPMHRRALALTIDLALCFIPLWLAYVILRGPNPSPINPLRFMVVFMGAVSVWALICLVYFAVLEGEYGYTAGKFMMYIRVIGEEGHPPGFGRALIRNFLLIIDAFFIFLVGVALIAFTENQQRLGDLAARTMVVTGTKS